MTKHFGILEIQPALYPRLPGCLLLKKQNTQTEDGQMSCVHLSVTLQPIFHSTTMFPGAGVCYEGQAGASLY